MNMEHFAMASDGEEAHSLSSWEFVKEYFSQPAPNRDSNDWPRVLKWLRGRSTLFTTLETEILSAVAETIRLQQVKADQVLMHQGEIGDSCLAWLVGDLAIISPDQQHAPTFRSQHSVSLSFYIILRGSASVHAKRAEDGEGPINEPIGKDITSARGPKERARFGQELCTLNAGRCFGELCIVAANCERNATVISNEASILLCIMRCDYERYVKKEITCELLHRGEYIKSHPLFKSWPGTYRNLLAESLQMRTVRYGELVFKQGNDVETVAFVIKGQAKLTMNPKAHHGQFPKLFASVGGDLKKRNDDESDFESDYVANRYRKLTLVEQRAAKRKHGFHTAEMLRREWDICTVGPKGLIGDVEAILDMDKYTVSAQCIEELTVYEIDKHSFIRVIVRKNPETFERMRKVIKDKITYRHNRILGGVPIYGALLASFSRTKARDERERLLHLYGQVKKENKRTITDFLERTRRLENTAIDAKSEQSSGEASKNIAGAAILLATGRLAGKMIKKRNERMKTRGGESQYSAEDYKDLKKRMQALEKVTTGSGWSGYTT